MLVTNKSDDDLSDSLTQWCLITKKVFCVCYLTYLTSFCYSFQFQKTTKLVFLWSWI